MSHQECNFTQVFFVLVKVSAGKPSVEFISTVTKNKDVGIFVYTDDD